MNIENTLKERFEAHGPECLTDAELLSLFLTVDQDTANSVLTLYDGTSNISNLMMLCSSELKNAGISNKKTTQLLCMNEIQKRMWRYADRDKKRFDYPILIACSIDTPPQLLIF